MADSGQMVFNLKITISNVKGEDEDDVYKHICNLLYDHDSDIVNVEEIE